MRRCCRRPPRKKGTAVSTAADCRFPATLPCNPNKPTASVGQAPRTVPTQRACCFFERCKLRTQPKLPHLLRHPRLGSLCNRSRCRRNSKSLPRPKSLCVSPVVIDGYVGLVGSLTKSLFHWLPIEQFAIHVSAAKGVAVQVRLRRSVMSVLRLLTVATCLFSSAAASAQLCGIPSYACCPPQACEPTCCYTTCKVEQETCYRTVCETVMQPEQYTAKRIVYETAYEEVPQTCYRTVTETAFRDEAYTVCRPVTENHVREETYCVQRPVWETKYRECNYTVQRPVWEDRVRECKYTVMQPVCETIERECRYTVMKPVCETIQQERCYTVMRPETRTRCVQRLCGEWVTKKHSIPGPCCPQLVCGPCGPTWCMRQAPPLVICRRVWCPRVVQQQVPYTVMVPQVVRQSCPVQVTRYVPETIVKKIPTQITRMCPKECVRRIPYRVCRMECEQKTQRIPYRVCQMVSEQKTRRIPYTVCRTVSEQRTRRIPYCVQKQVEYTSTRRVARCVPREVEYTCTRMVPKQITREVQYTRCRLVPQTICGDAYSSCSECQEAPLPHDASKPLEPEPAPRNEATDDNVT